MYVSRWCAECTRAVELLERHGLPFELIDAGDPDSCCRLQELTGGTSVPQAVVDGRTVGGYRELEALLRRSVPPPMRESDTSGSLEP